MHIRLCKIPIQILLHILTLIQFLFRLNFLRDSSLKGKAVIVGGSPEMCIVTTCSYEARKFGAHSAMPMKTAIRLCTHAIIVKGAYSELHKTIQVGYRNNSHQLRHRSWGQPLKLFTHSTLYYLLFSLLLIINHLYRCAIT